jgi:two-component system, sensor histidine kinase and response regulator
MVTLIAVAILSSWSIWQLREAIRYERQSYAVQSNVDDLYELVQGAESSQRGYLITGKEEYLNTYLNSFPQIPSTYARLKRSVRNLPLRPNQIAELDDLLNKKLEELKLTVILQQSEKEDDALALFQTDRGENLMTKLHEALDAIDHLAVQDAQVHEAFVRRYGTLLIVAIGGGSLLTLVLVLVFAFLARDEIQERIRSERELRSAQDAALVASKLKSQFLATVSHEIRTPLNGIIGMSDLLRVRLKDPEQRRFIDVIYNSGNALLKIVNDILDFSKIEAGKIDFEFSEFSLLETVEGTAELFAVKAKEKGLRLLSYVDSNVPHLVLGDASRTSQILRNLISNAVKFTDSGGVVVRVRLRFQSGSKAVVRFEVQDTGCGISETDQQLLFQPFNQVMSPQGARHEGTGLGLSICKDLAISMGGQVGVESKPAQGSTFWFEIPFKDVKSRSLADTQPPIPKSESVVCFSQTPLLDQVVALYASDLHFDARCTDSFDESIRDFIQSRSATVLVDMEGRTDDELSQLVRGCRSAGARSVVLLGRTQLEELSPKLRNESFTAILGSPFRREQLITILTGSMIENAEGAAAAQLATSGATSSNFVFASALSPSSTSGDDAPLILLVEDNQTNQLVAELILQGLGYRVHTVANGKEALEALTRITYDVVLMDCQMPVMDGFTATTEIRRQETSTGHHTPVIAMTANALSGDRERCLASGMDDFIAKPFQPSDLNRLLQKWLRPESKSVVDWTVLRELAQKTNETVVTKLIQSFLKTLPASLNEIRNAKEVGDRDALRAWAHQLKSSSASLGAMELNSLCAALESAAEAKEPKEKLDTLSAELLENGESVIESFRSQKRYL